MTIRPLVHPEAAAELRAEARYLNRQQAGLGADFVRRARAAREAVAENPIAWPLVPGWEEEPQVRSHSLGRFRIRLVYFVENGNVYVVAYAHESREPTYWRHRITGAPETAPTAGDHS